MELVRLLRELRVIPVVEMDDPCGAADLAEALLTSGLLGVEVTLRTSTAINLIASIKELFPGLIVGAGTVLSREQVRSAVAAGAQFLVAPGLDCTVLEEANCHDIPLLPGVSTPTEIEKALGLGSQVVKLFPAEALGGLEYLSAVAAPFPNVQFVPTGGIGPGNLPAYLAHPRVAACGGSWMVNKKLLAAHDYETVRILASQAAQLAGLQTTETARSSEGGSG